ncbi:putative transcription factor TIFY family [Rosa chinensis]|uniref:Protein TIFY n=1 Tax=Rosa chinensis TaxID=74649 RepID=A0A2P6Q1V2_ROSCH|nr:protein TIFY 8 isoform X2 [Rosa chinensis]PRQ28146.1 putative transcription factor TIFY family [Rosa chinensis]
MAVLKMALPSNNASTQKQQKLKQEEEDQLVKPMFHDFLGMKPSTDSPVVLGPKGSDSRLTEASPSASASLGGSSGGGRGPISTTSDLGSERQAGNHLEGVPYYGPRSDISGPEISNRILGSKRSNSDSTFMGSSRDGIPHMGPDSLESSHLMKMFRNGTGGERPRRSIDDEAVFATQPMRPTSANLIFQTPHGGRVDNNISKWERSTPMNLGGAVQYPPRGGHFAPFVHQLPSNRFRDANAGANNISQLAADEGSRTGIKGPGILSAINASSGASDRNSSVVLPSGSRQKSGTNTSEPEPLTPSRHGFASANRQMTIFYGGQAHVFDDVHPNKADVIMALAGSNGGSWSTTYSLKPTVKPGSESHMPSGEVETGTASNVGLVREYRGRLSIPGNSSPGVGFADRILTAAGGHQGSNLAKDTRNPVQATEPGSKEKIEL